MTCWLERAESRYLDLITASAEGLIELAGTGRFPDKYDIFREGLQRRDLFQGIPSQIVDSQIKNFSGLSQGRYIREMAYALLALDLAEDLFWKEIGKIKVSSFSDLTRDKLMIFVQSGNSKYKPLEAAVNLSKQTFGSDKWAEILRRQILSYGYFVRYLDCIITLTGVLKTEPIYITQIKNLIGPYDKIVKGGGPDFVQETFKTWGFFLNILNLKTGGKLENYDCEKRLQYLRSHTGFITDGKNAYSIIRNIRKTKITLNYQEIDPIRIICFMRLADLNEWRDNFDSAVGSALRRLRLIYLLRYGDKFKGSDMLGDYKMQEVERFFKCKRSIIEDLLFLESAGMRFSVVHRDKRFYSVTDFMLRKAIERNPNILEDMKTITTKSVFFDNIIKIIPSIKISELEFCSERRVDFNAFQKYLFNGELLKWIQES
jgi:hypothetical protein